MGWSISDFRPFVSALGDIEATVRCVDKPEVVWVPCFRHRDIAAASRWARKHGVPLVFDPLISAYQKRVFERRVLVEGSAGAKRLLEKERKLFGLADVVIADTDAHRKLFRELLKVPYERMFIVYVGASSEFSPILPVEREPGDPLEVLFYGSFLPLHGVETIIEAARLTQGEPIRWTLLGSGPGKAACIKAASSLSNVSFENPVPMERLCDRIQEADVLLGIFGDTAQASRVMPNKFFQSIASGRPIVTRDSPAYPDCVRQSPGVALVPPCDPRSLVDAVRGFADRKTLSKAAVLAHLLYEKTFSEKVICSQLWAVLARYMIP